MFPLWLLIECMLIVCRCRIRIEIRGGTIIVIAIDMRGERRDPLRQIGHKGVWSQGEKG